MAEASAAWSEVAASFSGLGQKLRTHFEQARAAEPPSSPAPDAATPPTPPADDAGAPAGAPTGGTDDQVRAAVRKLAEAIDDVVEAVGAAVKDPAVKEDVRKVGGTLTEALSTSFAEVSEDLRRAFRRSDQAGDTATTTPPSSTPPAGGPADPTAPASGTEPSGE